MVDEQSREELDKLNAFSKRVKLKLAETYEAAANQLVFFDFQRRGAIRHTSATIGELGSEKLKDLASVVMVAIIDTAQYARDEPAFEPGEEGFNSNIVPPGTKFSSYRTPVGTLTRGTIDAAVRFWRKARSGGTLDDYAIEKAETVLRHMAGIHYAKAHNLI